MIYDLDGVVRAKMFGYTSQLSGAWHNGMKAPNHIILYGAEGVMGIEMEGKQYRIGIGDVLLIPMGTFYRPLEGGACTYYFFHFQANVLSNGIDLPLQAAIAPHTGLIDGDAYTCLSNYTSAVRVPDYLNGTSVAVRHLFERASKLRPNKSFCDQLLLDHLLRELLILLGENRTILPPNLIKITDYIEQNYAQDLSLSALSRHFAFSTSYIARLFQKQLGQKPSYYVNSVRVSVASTLLLETNLSVTEIAERTGFSDVYYFSRVFKKTVGRSPLQMRVGQKNAVSD